jgi:hypothetical protein
MGLRRLPTAFFFVAVVLPRHKPDFLNTMFHKQRIIPTFFSGRDIGT